LADPGWADHLIQALASPGVAVLLLVIGGVALYIELHSPGMGIGAFAAAICFLLFFWSRYLGGTAGWLEVSLFAAGVVCLLLEIFVIPGFGIFGLGGGALVLVSLILASQTFVWPHNEYQVGQLEQSLLTVAGAGIKAFSNGPAIIQIYSLDTIIALLNNYGTKEMAEDFINCGDADLKAAGESWALKNGYIVHSGQGSHRVTYPR